MRTFKFAKEVPCADANGKEIFVGSVLRNLKDGCRGVVNEICDGSKKFDIPMIAVGDIAIRTSLGSQRITNCYGDWQHIAHNDQTYEERFQSWLHTKYEHDVCFGEQTSKDTGVAISGIMALLPDNVIDYDFDTYPQRIEDALEFLLSHIDELRKVATPAQEGGAP